MIVLVFGLPGSGKSYFSAKLADRLGAQYISSDRIRIGMNLSGKYTFEDKVSVYKEMAMVAGMAIEQGRDVVVDGTFYHHSMRDLFVDLAGSHQTSLHFIEITSNDDTVKERLSKRRKESEADYSVYQQIKKQFDQVNSPHLRLHSGRNNIEDMLSTALNYLTGKTHE
jgi:predicted kinase